MSEQTLENQGLKGPDKNSRLNVIKFALLTSLICSLLITSAATGLKNFQLKNMETDRKKNILKACDLLDSQKKASKKQINQLYTANIKEVMVNPEGKIIKTHTDGALKLFLYEKNDGKSGYIIPINTRGLWGKIQGYLAFENDGQTVSGFSVFSHSETPGLGGEIESTWFQKNFKGKKIINSQNKFVSVGIAKGKVKNLPKEDRYNYVDGISGATLTGKYLSEGIKETLTQYNPVSVTFRQKQLRIKEQKE
ncbi:MAG: FMN-binding protein [Desulfobacteraceae bacterium]|nr:FMN-binding protein [Desulfobacteraceae bacterium]